MEYYIYKEGKIPTGYSNLYKVEELLTVLRQKAIYDEKYEYVDKTQNRAKTLRTLNKIENGNID